MFGQEVLQSCKPLVSEAGERVDIKTQNLHEIFCEVEFLAESMRNSYVFFGKLMQMYWLINRRHVGVSTKEMGTKKMVGTWFIVTRKQRMGGSEAPYK